jgi:DNA-binding CsgD family transcriptional regulator
MNDLTESRDLGIIVSPRDWSGLGGISPVWETSMPAAETTTKTRYQIDKLVVRPIVQRFLAPFSLSKRELEAIVLLTEGAHAKEIAQRMSCSEKNVYAHLARACKKIGCRDYHDVICTVLAFACDVLAHARPEESTVNRYEASIPRHSSG